jgi:hypothetical protein
MRTAVLAAVAALAAGIAVPAHATPTNGCTVSSPSECSFVATGDVNYVAAGLAGCTFRVIRNFSTVYTFSGNLPPVGTITQAEAGDTIRVTAGFASAPYMITYCDARDAQ